MRSYLSFRTLTAAALSFGMGMFLASAAVQGVAAQTVAALHQPPAAVAVHDDAKTSNTAPGAPAVTPDPDVPPAVARQLAAMQAEIEELKAALKSRDAVEPVAMVPATAATGPATLTTPAPAAPETAVAVAPPSPAPIEKAVVQAANDASAASTKKEKIAPFSDWDWTWLNGNPRNKDTAFDSKFFTPEIRADVTYSYSFNKPVDNSMGGSSELFRSNEIQLEQLGIGGDFHLDNVRARFMTQFGMYSTATVRNDPSYAKGQWNIGDADRYVSEAYGGYHLDVLNGINIDAGIFMSYVGLFSYYNFDNWAYQPSYVSSNTPWFFEGVRIQVFPTAHLKIEPWIINGWQSYGSSNSRKGLGGQIKWTPYSWMNIISNNYGLGHDDLYIPNRGRMHTDNSVEIKYFDRPGQFLGQDGVLLHRRSRLRIRPQHCDPRRRELLHQQAGPAGAAERQFPAGGN